MFGPFSLIYCYCRDNKSLCEKKPIQEDESSTYDHCLLFGNFEGNLLSYSVILLWCAYSQVKNNGSSLCPENSILQEQMT